MTRTVTRVVVLGGYGKAGRRIAEGLLETTEGVDVTVAGRTGSSARAVADELTDHGADHGSTRVSAEEVDATDRESLVDCFAAHDLAVVAVPLRGRAGPVVEALVETGVDSVDLVPDESKADALERVADRIESQGQRVLTQAGVVPGCPGVVARAAADRLDSVTRIELRSLMNDDVPEGGAYDIVASTGESAGLYRQGRWRPATVLDSRWLDFGPRFGTRLAVPTTLDELRALPDRLDCEELSAYQAGINPGVDALFLLWGALGLARWERGRDLGATLFVRLNRLFGRPPYGLAVSARADGTREDRPATASVRIEHTDLYDATAIPAVATVRAVLADEVTAPGVQYAAHAVEPAAFLDRISAQGMTVTRRH